MDEKRFWHFESDTFYLITHAYILYIYLSIFYYVFFLNFCSFCRLFALFVFVCAFTTERTAGLALSSVGPLSASVRLA
jgi:hypothetical protein